MCLISLSGALTLWAPQVHGSEHVGDSVESRRAGAKQVCARTTTGIWRPHRRQHAPALREPGHGSARAAANDGITDGLVWSLPPPAICANGSGRRRRKEVWNVCVWHKRLRHVCQRGGPRLWPCSPFFGKRSDREADRYREKCSQVSKHTSLSLPHTHTHTHKHTHA